MEKLIKVRKVSRSAFSKSLNRLMTKLKADVTDTGDIKVLYEIVSEHAANLERLNREVLDAMIDGDCDEAKLEEESETAEEYKIKFGRVKLQIVETLGDHDAPRDDTGDNASLSNENAMSRRNFKLPKIELKKFGGDVKEWLQFWSQFKKIHEDKQIGNEDKFQYLLQAMTQGSRASELVQSFPPTAENYDKVIKSLKSRFGRDELLVEVYVRELLKLVLQNAMKTNEKPQLASLYDKLESHIRALESLGVTTDTCAAMLYPLVESSLPEELLRAWQRGIVLGNNVESKERLTKLLKFIESEVENEERIAMAIKGFGLSSESEKQKKSKPRMGMNNVPTATGLLTTKDDKMECVFCNGEHQSADCHKARQMTMQEKQTVLKQKNCCFNCSKVGHSYKKCRAKLKCPWCSRKHIVVMCPDMSMKRENSTQKSQSDTNNNVENNLANFSNNPEVLLQTLRVRLRGERSYCEVRAIIDSGSQRSYIAKDAAAAVDYVPIGRQKLTHALFGGVKSKEQNHSLYRMRLSSLDDEYACKFEVLENETICSKIPSVRIGPWTEELRELGIGLSDTLDDAEPIQILIGADVTGKLMTGRFHILKSGPVAVETLLGWTLMGKLPIKNERSDAALTVMSMFAKEASVADLWELEALGIVDPSNKKTKEERERKTIHDFLETVRIDDEGRYEVRLPWVEDHPPLTSNRSLSQKRLEATTKSLKTGGYFDDYDKVLREWLTDGIIERVPDTEVDNFGHYLPHRHVVKKDSTTKLRPVFDASAKEKSHPSLNLCVEKGPNLIELIPTILMRFREGRFGVVADIKKAFLQISVCPQDRDFLRFLWWDPDTHKKIEIYRHCRVVFGVSCSPFLLGAVIELHLKRILQEIENLTTEECSKATLLKLMRSFYVDDCNASVDSPDELHRFAKESTAVMASGGFELRGWEHTGEDRSGDRTKVIGLIWDKSNDTLEINVSALNNELPTEITKKTILAIAQAIFDPIGFTSPVTLSPKLLLQEIWSEKIDWDTEVNESVKLKFVAWFQELTLLSNVKIPRHMFAGASYRSNISLHTFCDASRVAYAAAVYVRVETNEGVKLQLLQAKSRVAPMKVTTIPRLELLAATIEARLTISVLEALNWTGIPTYLWSDSTTVLSWITRQAEWGIFVWNRVQEIRKLTNHENWRHVPGEINPADLPSRGCTVSQLLASQWWTGPRWLLSPPQEWPSAKFAANEEKVQHELKKSTTVMINHDGEEDSNWYSRRYSKYRDILRLVAWVRRYVNNCRAPRRQRRFGGLSIDELNEAEVSVLRLIQNETFSSESDPRITSLNGFRSEDGLIRLKTKIVSRQDTYNFRYPVILPGRHDVVHRLIRDKHLDMCHAGVQTLMNQLREEFWILGGRRAIRAIIQKCAACKRQEVKNLESEPAPLPVNRVKDAVVFEISGVDFAGPVFLKEGKKAWICLFTCAVYRAVHLELVSSLTTTAFLEAFRRFVARRGRPHTMYSDNGTNFVGAVNLFEKINWQKITDYSSAHRVQWKFNPPTAAWWGGWWERLIGLVKRLLRRVLGKACLTYEEMMTTLCDCESVVNSRPITYVSEGSEDMIPLTPKMYLQDIRESGVPDCDNVDRNSMTRRLRYRQKLRDDLRRRFRIEYLGQLVHRYKTKMDSRKIHIGDVVLVGCDNQRRLDWPLARVIETVAGKDGEIRVVRLKTSTGELLRPIQRVYPLELSDKPKKENVETEPEDKECLATESRSEEDKTSPIQRVEAPGIREKAAKLTRRGRAVKLPSRYA